MLARKHRAAICVFAIGAAVFGVSAGTAAAAQPQIESVGVAEASVTANAATLIGTVNANGVNTTYRFEYLTAGAYEGNLEAGRDAFSGAQLAPASGAGPVGAGTSPEPVRLPISGLTPATAYRYRLRVTNSFAESALSPARPFATAAPTNAFELLDHRGWEMVSPIDKGGGAVQAPGAISGGGVFQAAGGGGWITYSSADSFGAGAQGAPSGSQYLAGRTEGGWVSTNVTTPLLSGSFGSQPDGVPYQLFSESLELAVLSNGERCRGSAGGECPVANPPLPGTGAPAGYRDYYRRNAAGSFESVLTAGDLPHTSLGPSQIELTLVAATPDLAHLVVSSCAALTADATETPAAGGCDPAAQNLYEWSGGALSLINLLPGEAAGTPGATIAAPAGAISTDGSRVYFTSGGAIYLREGNGTKLVSTGPGVTFEAASADGSTAYLVDSGALDRYSAAAGTATPLTTGGGVEGVLGVSATGSTVYYADGGVVLAWEGATSTTVASTALSSDWPAATGTARVSADGAHLLFLSAAELTGYPNEGKTEAFLYGPPPGGVIPLLVCVSCNPSGERPHGSASIPGARANGTAADATRIYKPRALSVSGNRAFFETVDGLVPQDTNRTVDVYEWEAAGEGTCVRGGGCVQLISGGRDPGPSVFLDADERGGEAFFLTAASLFALDPGSDDVYVAREGGGFGVPEAPMACVADACQILPEAPEDPTPGTLTPNSGNPVLKIAGTSKGGKKSKKKHKKHRKRKTRGKK